MIEIKTKGIITITTISKGLVMVKGKRKHKDHVVKDIEVVLDQNSNCIVIVLV
jgi:hypothetical protein